MHAFRRICRTAALPLAMVFVIQMVPASASFAGLVSTEQVLANESHSLAHAKIRAFIERDDIRKQFESLGVAPEEALSRVNAMSDEEAVRVAGMLDTLPAGQDAFVAFVAAVGVLLLVLVFTDLMGITDVFPFIPSRRVR